MSIDNGAVAFYFNKRIEGITRSMNRVTYETLAAMIVRLDEVSPVGDVMLWSPKNRAKALSEGYVGGQFRGNWQLGVNQRPVGWLEGKIDPSGVNTVGENIGRIPAAASRGYKFYLVNNVPYARELEDGHSTQMPAHTLTRVRGEYSQMVAKVAEQIKSEGGRVR
jgi:hypothetical protein